MTRYQLRFACRFTALHVLSVIGLSLAAACASAPASNVAVRAAPEPAAALNPNALASVEDTLIQLDNVPPTTQQQLANLANEYAQRRFAVLWAGVEEAVAERLLTAEALRQHLSLNALLKQEVESKVGTPSDAEIRGLYEANRRVIDVPFEVASSGLKQQWHEDRVVQLRHALIDKLRATAHVHYHLKAPDLPRYNVEIGPGEAMGSPKAPVTIVEFGDYQCPYTAQARRLLHRVMEVYPQQVRWIYRDYPLEQHPLARRAAEAAQCAGEQHKFWAYNDLLFENNQALELGDLRRYAKEADLNIGAFNDCLVSPRPKVIVAQNERDARQFGVSGTPAIFVNGMRIEGVLPLPLMQAIIDHELEKL